MRKHGFKRRVLSFGFTVVAGAAMAGLSASPGHAADTQTCGFALAAWNETPESSGVDAPSPAPAAPPRLYTAGVESPEQPSETVEVCSIPVG